MPSVALPSPLKFLLFYALWKILIASSLPFMKIILTTIRRVLYTDLIQMQRNEAWRAGACLLSLIIASLCSDGRGESIHPAVTQPPAGPRCDAPISDAANRLIDAALLNPTYSLLILKLINSCCFFEIFKMLLHFEIFQSTNVTLFPLPGVVIIIAWITINHKMASYHHPPTAECRHTHDRMQLDSCHH